MIFGLSSKILEDRLLPVSLHIVPIVDHTMADGVVDAISRSLLIRNGLVTDEEVEVFDTSLGRKITRLGWYGRACA